MSKKRDKQGQYKRKYSARFIAGVWVASFASVGLLYVACQMVVADFSGFRSCSINSSGLYVHSCGKQSVNVGDLGLLLLFILAACLTVSLFTYAFRVSQRPK